MQLNAYHLACKYSLWCCSVSRRLSTSILNRFAGSTYYTVLGVKQDASFKQIKDAFVKKSKEIHPDIDPSNPELHSQFIQLNEAYSVLSRLSSRHQYDAKLQLQRQHLSHSPFQHQAGSGTKDDPFIYTDLKWPRTSYEKSEQVRYWEQFRYASPEEYDAMYSEKRTRRNRKLVAYCFLIMTGSLLFHYISFRKLEEVHSAFMDEKDRVIGELYKESKERARLNGFKKQQEILRQKHTEFVEKYKMKYTGTDEK
ncbi:dnaJ homolog subfamily C member 4 [Protopterus annectens]|uniref:dnaJ homolog subfamily C member 4 n=1 Tax=Protopterus annectens TaxID=7888 RepID=UPI001CFA6D04|nr:dnaJ homolog subfamily C member 4 [Protopterus annectens]XP_043931664.1 dnaJ homolog subfamily C member 4 [Protopterus annectens]XP_043931665.1 dnaJ homolog subfamily C member 4 [Protopterus annectens]XP_043931666.1 dnaJ homolog subfamily C member 4 [Protopterus annectens]